jgi:hypothetical protein
MLRHDVVEAVAAGQFHIYPIATIDEGIEVLTGVPAGVADNKGVYPKQSINRFVQDRLTEVAAKRRQFDTGEDGDNKGAPPKRKRAVTRRVQGSAEGRVQP